MFHVTRTMKTVAAAAALMMALGGTALAAEPSKGPAPTVLFDPKVNPVQTIEGVLEYNDLEGGFYTLGGWALNGDRELYSTLQGQELLIQGKQFEGSTIWQVPTLDVSGIYRALNAGVTLPGTIQVAGKPLSFDQGPVSQNGKTLIPLRFVAEAVGAKVSWDGETRTATVEMADRTVMFTVGQAEAELNKRGVFYIRRNLIPISQAPVIMGNRMMIPADSLTQILGIYQAVEKDSQSLNLAIPQH